MQSIQEAKWQNNPNYLESKPSQYSLEAQVGITPLLKQPQVTAPSNNKWARAEAKAKQALMEFKWNFFTQRW